MNPYYTVTPKTSGQIRTSISNPTPGGGNINWSNSGGVSPAAIGQAALGGVSLTGDLIGMSNQGLGLRGQAPQQLNTQMPSYSGDFYNRALLSQVQKTTGGEVLTGAAKGAASGAAFGPEGALVGAAVGGLGTVFAGNRRRRRQTLERDQALEQAYAYQGDYNQASQAYQAQQDATADYTNRLRQSTRSLYA